MVSLITCVYEDTTQVHSCAFLPLIHSNVEPERLPNHTREDFISSDLTSYLIFC